jgi:hypothetical protein
MPQFIFYCYVLVMVWFASGINWAGLEIGTREIYGWWKGKAIPSATFNAAESYAWQPEYLQIILQCTLHDQNNFDCVKQPNLNNGFLSKRQPELWAPAGTKHLLISEHLIQGSETCRIGKRCSKLAKIFSPKLQWQDMHTLERTCCVLQTNNSAGSIIRWK